MARDVLTLSPAEENSMDKAVIELLARARALPSAGEFPEDVTPPATQAANAWRR